MSEIKAGDLVMVVRWPCCGSGLGLIRQALEIEVTTSVLVCSDCRSPHRINDAVRTDASNHAQAVWASRAWLRKMPPLSEADEAQAEVTAPIKEALSPVKREEAASK